MKSLRTTALTALITVEPSTSQITQCPMARFSESISPENLSRVPKAQPSCNAEAYKLLERAPERQKARIGVGRLASNCAKAAISSGDW